MEFPCNALMLMYIVGMFMNECMVITIIIVMAISFRIELILLLCNGCGFKKFGNFL